MVLAHLWELFLAVLCTELECELNHFGRNLPVATTSAAAVGHSSQPAPAIATACTNTALNENPNTAINQGKLVV